MSKSKFDHVDPYRRLYLAHDIVISIRRTARGNVAPGANDRYEETVGEAMRRGDFSTDSGTMEWDASLLPGQVDEEINSDVCTDKNGRPFVYLK